jgi:hypothetical protein
MYMPLLTQRNPTFWGPDADVFDPERWIQPERIAKFATNPMMFAPFSAGPRIVSSFLPIRLYAYPVVVHWSELCI